MSINPAGMDQCSIKCRCLSGVNQGLAYDCEQPCAAGQVFNADLCDCVAECSETCPNGFSGSIAVTQYLMKVDGSVETQAYYLPFAPTSQDPGLRVYQGSVQYFDACGGSWIDVSPLVYTPGGDIRSTGETLSASVSSCDHCASGGLAVYIYFITPEHGLDLSAWGVFYSGLSEFNWEGAECTPVNGSDDHANIFWNMTHCSDGSYLRTGQFKGICSDPQVGHGLYYEVFEGQVKIASGQTVITGPGPTASS